MNAIKTRKPAELRVEQVQAGRKTLTCIYRRRWCISVTMDIRETQVRLFRNASSKCEVHGTNVRCSHVIQLEKRCQEYGLWL
jgi:hypothetical protein